MRARSASGSGTRRRRAPAAKLANPTAPRCSLPDAPAPRRCHGRRRGRGLPSAASPKRQPRAACRPWARGCAARGFAPSPVRASCSPAAAPRRAAQENRLHRDTPFLCDFRFRTPLPPPPIGPKLLPLVVDRSRFTAYRPFNLWWDRPSELPWEIEVGQALDPMDVEQHRVPPGPPRPLHPADEALLAPLTSGPPIGSGPGFRPGKSKPTAKAGWLMRTLYLSDSQLPKVRKHSHRAAARRVRR